MSIFIIDGKNNGKDNILTKYDKIFIYDCYIQNDILYVNNDTFDSEIKNVIFDFNETYSTYNLGWNNHLKKQYLTVQQMIEAFCSISTYIKTHFPNIVIYNDPNIWFKFGSKIEIYKAITNIKNDVFKFFKYSNIQSIEDIENIDFYPVIIKTDIGSHTKNDTICKDEVMLKECYNEKFKHENNVICIEYKNTYIDEIDKYMCVRLMVINEIIYDFYARPSNSWNIHTDDQCASSIVKTNHYFMEFFEKNKYIINDFIKQFHSISGNGFFVYDVILSDNNLYLCEVGLKFYDSTYSNFLKKNKIKLNKPSTDPNYIRNIVDEILL